MPLAVRVGAWFVCIVLLAMGFVPQAAADWPRLLGGSSSAQPGTPEWWRANKNKAVHEVGQGYKVPGVEGYFDANGRPIDAPVSAIARSTEDEDEEQRGIAPWLNPKPAVNRARTAMGYGPNVERARQALAAADVALREQDYDRAEDLFEEAVARAPNSAIEQRAMFGLGESHLFRDEYSSALEVYGELLDEYPSTPNFDDVIERLWAIGQYWDERHRQDQSWAITPNFFDHTRPRFDTGGNAIKAYEAIRLNDPTGPRADDALMATAGIYFRRHQYQDADYHYTLLRREYPRSEFQFEAHLLGLQTKLRKYKGPDYDGAPLEEAKKLVKQIRTQFAGRLSPAETERLQRTQADVARMIAERDLRMGKYYEDTRHNLAARFYYGRAAKKYANTGVGAEAQSRMTALAGQPDVPEERLSWFVEMFPENAERARVARVPELQSAPTMVADQRGDAAGDASPQGTTTR